MDKRIIAIGYLPISGTLDESKLGKIERKSCKHSKYWKFESLPDYLFYYFTYLNDDSDVKTIFDELKIEVRRHQNVEKLILLHFGNPARLSFKELDIIQGQIEENLIVNNFSNDTTIGHLIKSNEHLLPETKEQLNTILDNIWDEFYIDPEKFSSDFLFKI